MVDAVLRRGMSDGVCERVSNLKLLPSGVRNARKRPVDGRA